VATFDEFFEKEAARARGKGRAVLVLAAVGVIGLATASAAGAQVRCGDTIAPGAHVVLTADLVCDDVETALTITGPAVLDLNGFAIVCDDRNGNGREVIGGVALEGAAATLRGGTVRDCRQAIALRGAGRHLVSGMLALRSSSDGFRVESDRNQVLDSFALLNGGAGFAVAGKANRIAGNAATSNRQGFDVEQRNTLERNIASGSEFAGFALRTKSATLRQNRAVGNQLGFNVRGRSTRLEGNEAENNLVGFFFESFSRRNVLVGSVAIGSTLAGILVAGEANRLLQSRAEENGTEGIRIGAGAKRTVVRASSARDNGAHDLSDATPGCGTNRWRSNDFGSSNDPCIE